MDKAKIKIPIIAVTHIDVTEGSESINEETLYRNTNYYSTLYNADKLKELSDVAHLFFVNDGDNLVPVSVKWLRYCDDETDIEEGSFPLKEIANFNIGEFQVQDAFDTFYDAVIPKYIIINNN